MSISHLNDLIKLIKPLYEESLVNNFCNFVNYLIKNNKALFFLNFMLCSRSITTYSIPSRN